MVQVNLIHHVNQTLHADHFLPFVQGVQLVLIHHLVPFLLLFPVSLANHLPLFLQEILQYQVLLWSLGILVDQQDQQGLSPLVVQPVLMGLVNQLLHVVQESPVTHLFQQDLVHLVHLFVLLDLETLVDQQILADPVVLVDLVFLAHLFGQTLLWVQQILLHPIHLCYQKVLVNLLILIDQISRVLLYFLEFQVGQHCQEVLIVQLAQLPHDHLLVLWDQVVQHYQEGLQGLVLHVFLEDQMVLFLLAILVHLVVQLNLEDQQDRLILFHH